MKNQHIYHLCKIHTLWIFSYVSQEFPQHCLAPEEQFGDNHQGPVYLARNLIWVPPPLPPELTLLYMKGKVRHRINPLPPSPSLPSLPLSPPELQHGLENAKQKCDRHACELWITENTLLLFPKLK